MALIAKIDDYATGSWRKRDDNLVRLEELIAKIDDYATGREIGVKMTSAIGNLAIRPLTLLKL